MKKIILLTVLFLLSINSVQSQNKATIEKNGIKIKFLTTQLGEISNNEFKLINDMKLSGVFIFIPDKKSVVIRHDNGNDELLEVLSTSRTPDGNNIFGCNKDRVLVISIKSKMIFYSIAGNSSVFLFPINERDIASLSTLVTKY
jgi:hypothetical protein